MGRTREEQMADAFALIESHRTRALLVDIAESFSFLETMAGFPPSRGVSGGSHSKRDSSPIPATLEAAGRLRRFEKKLREFYDGGIGRDGKPRPEWGIKWACDTLTFQHDDPMDEAEKKAPKVEKPKRVVSPAARKEFQERTRFGVKP